MTLPSDLVRRLSFIKGLAVASDGGREIIISADTIVTLDNEVLGKPGDAEDAVEMLTRLRGRKHLVFSGVTVLDVLHERMINEAVQTAVWMRAYSDQEISEYVASGDPLDKAGAYAIQYANFSPVERIEGCYANVMGLPLCHLYRGLAALGTVPQVHPLHGCPQAAARGCPWAQEILDAQPVVIEGELAERLAGQTSLG